MKYFVHYINVGNMPKAKAEEQVSRVRNLIGEENKKRGLISDVWFFVPVRESENKIELLYAD